MNAADEERVAVRNGKAQEALKRILGPDGTAFLLHALGSILRVLPHTTVTAWRVARSDDSTRVKWVDSTRRAISMKIRVPIEGNGYCVAAEVSRRAALSGVGNIKRTLEPREFDLCLRVAERISEVLRAQPADASMSSIRAIRSLFDQHVVAVHLQQHHQIRFDLGAVLAELRHLAERSYENKSISFGLLVRRGAGDASQVFPSAFFKKKRYQALSDGFRTAFEVRSSGELLGLKDLRELSSSRTDKHFYPEWCEEIAEASTSGSCGIALTRQGDVLVFDSGSLRFTCRSGQWQYWNHAHACDLFRNTARVQHVHVNVLPKVVKSIYRVALDVSFRRSGALFVLLRNRQNKHKLVVPGDGIGDDEREALHKAFDETLVGARVQTMSRALLAEVSSIDGGVVLDNQGALLAYGAVLKTSGRFHPSEGSRTKAAVSASRLGIAVKVSSDGDITFYSKGKPFLEL